MALVLKKIHDRLYRTFEQKEVYTRKGALARVRLRSLLEILDELQGKTVLDVGCAEGTFTLSMARSRSYCIGLDFVKVSLERLRKAASKRKLTNLDVVLSDVQYLPIRTKSIDLILCSEVLEHVLRPEAVLTELSRVADHYVVLSIPCAERAKIRRYSYYSNEEMRRYLEYLMRTTKTTHLHTFTMNTILRMIRNAGLVVNSVSRVLFTFPWLALILRLFPSLEQVEYNLDKRLLRRIPLSQIPHAGFGNRYITLVCKPHTRKMRSLSKGGSHEEG